MANEMPPTPSSHGPDNDLENGYGNALQTSHNAGSIIMSPELLEKLYLSPGNKEKCDLRKTFGNPAPLALAGFLVSLTPLACTLIGWRGAGGGGAAQIGVCFFMGGLCMVLGGLLEFFLGNTFPFVVFTSFGGFWLSFGGTLAPGFGAISAYATVDDPTGLKSSMFYNTYAFFLLFMSVLCFVYFICSLRTNICLATILFTITIGIGLLAGSYWNIGQENVKRGADLQVAAGGFLFAACMVGWYLFVAVMLPSVDFPWRFPVGDLSTVIRGASERRKAKGAQNG